MEAIKKAASSYQGRDANLFALSAALSQTLGELLAHSVPDYTDADELRLVEYRALESVRRGLRFGMAEGIRLRRRFTT